MGIPYSKQINAAFDQVTPLVAEGFEVLQTTRNITFLLAEIQVATVVLLFLILVTMMMLLVTLNPDLERERQSLITPVMRWLCSWMMDTNSGKRRIGFAFFLATLVLAGAGYVHYWYYFSKEEASEAPDSEQVPGQEGKDVDAIKDGKSSQ
ncbi:hypothetical protein CLAFUR4_14245 [Fulvia fulva]|nr:hypothetical protein CLAFUR4_14245 [Fulvia fulva]KAK4609491.1 hypothetical protein CLAFUR0_14250 [Fulvia fulva]WPV37595.1 hypothetical protein CLAFUW7_14253 [Fulvia fulva]